MIILTVQDKAAVALDYTFQNTGLLEVALRHASVADNRRESNERMEFMGDSILSFVVCEYIYQNYPNLLEGELTKIKSAVVSRRVCAQISQELGLASMLNLGKGMAGKDNLPGSVSAAVFEAIIAAMYFDGGLEPVKRFILRYMIKHIGEAAGSAHQHNFKSVLQQVAQRKFNAGPTYTLLDEKGPDHAKIFEVCVVIEGRRFGSAWGNAKKQAEQDAALNALVELEVAAKDDDGRVRILAPAG